MAKKDLIFYEVELQNDFLNENGRLYVPGAENIKPAIEQLATYAIQNKIKRVRGMDRHFANDSELQANGGPFPNHCMDKQYGEKDSNGNYGIDLIPEVKPQKQTHIWNKMDEHGMTPGYTDFIIEELVKRDGDLAIEKQDYDIFTNKFAEVAFNKLGVKRAVVYGVATDYCVKDAVLGMQSRGIQTYVVKDAIKGVNLPTGSIENAIAEMTAAGAKFVTTKDVLEDRI